MSGDPDNWVAEDNNKASWRWCIVQYIFQGDLYHTVFRHTFGYQFTGMLTTEQNVIYQIAPPERVSPPDQVAAPSDWATGSCSMRANQGRCPHHMGQLTVMMIYNITMLNIYMHPVCHIIRYRMVINRVGCSSYLAGKPTLLSKVNYSQPLSYAIIYYITYTNAYTISQTKQVLFTIV